MGFRFILAKRKQLKVKSILVKVNTVTVYSLLRLNFLVILQADRITKLYNMMQIIIEDVLPDGSWVSLIDFDSYAKLLTDFVQLNSTVTRQKLVSLVPSTANGGTCIPCGLDMAIQVRYKMSTKLFSIYMCKEKKKKTKHLH